jgi:hypothetical protein
MADLNLDMHVDSVGSDCSRGICLAPEALQYCSADAAGTGRLVALLRAPLLLRPASLCARLPHLPQLGPPLGAM